MVSGTSWSRKRATSSTTSISRRTSRARQLGTSTCQSTPTVKPSRSRRSRCSASGISSPSTSVGRPGLNEITARGATWPRTSVSPLQRAPASSTSNCEAYVAAGPASSGSTPFSQRVWLSVRMRCRSPLRSTVSGSKFAASSRIDVVSSLTSVLAPPITPAIPDRPGGVRDHEILRVEPALRPVERLELLARRRPAHDDPSAVELVEIERVQRVAEREHHVVGDVDHVRDRPHAGSEQARLQPRGRLADQHVAEEPSDVAWAVLEILDADVDRLVASARRLGAWHRFELRRPSAPRPRARSRRSTSGRDGCRASRSRGCRRRPAARLRAASRARSSSGSSMIPPWSCPSSSSRSERIIPSDTSPRSLRFSIVNSPPGMTPPGDNDRDGRARAEVPGAADDRARLALRRRRPSSAAACRRSDACPASSTLPTTKCSGCRRCPARRDGRRGRPRSS